MLKEAGEVISDRFLIAMVVNGLPPNFKPFTTVITEKKKTLAFSEFKVCFEEMLQMKTTFKKTNLRNKLGISAHSRYDYKSINYNYKNYQKLQYSQEDYKPPPTSREGKYYLCLWEERPQSISM